MNEIKYADKTMEIHSKHSYISETSERSPNIDAKLLKVLTDSDYCLCSLMSESGFYLTSLLQDVRQKNQKKESDEIATTHQSNTNRIDSNDVCATDTTLNVKVVNAASRYVEDPPITEGENGRKNRLNNFEQAKAAFQCK